MREFCVKRKGQAEWERVFKAQSLEAAAREFVTSNDLVGALDQILVVENKAFGKCERASFPAHQLESRDGWNELIDAQESRGDVTQQKEGSENGFVAEEAEASKYITKIREESGYRLLRKVIADVSMLLIIVIILGCGITVAKVAGSFGANGWVILEIMKDSVISLLVVLVVSKISIVLIDVADLLIEQNRKK